MTPTTKTKQLTGNEEKELPRPPTFLSRVKTGPICSPDIGEKDYCGKRAISSLPKTDSPADGSSDRETTKAPTHGKNLAPRVDKYTWDPFKRYWDAKASSLPDYGPLGSGGGGMMGTIQRVASFFKPTNTLGNPGQGQRQTQQTQQSAPKRAAETSLSQSAKRQRTNHGDYPLPSTAGGDGALDRNSVQGTHSRTDPKGSLKSHSTADAHSPSLIIGEFRDTSFRSGIGGAGGGTGRRRRRKGASQEFHSPSVAQRRAPSLQQRHSRKATNDPIDDDDDDDDVVELVEAGGSMSSRQPETNALSTYTSSTFSFFPGTDSEDEIASEQPTAKKSDHSVHKPQAPPGRGNATGIKRQNTSEDELQEPTDPPLGKRRMQGNGTMIQSTKGSSSRADIQRTNFAKAGSTNAVFGKGGLPIKRAVCTPAYIYPAKGSMPADAQGASDAPCTLGSDVQSPLRLLPMNEHSQESLTLGWMRLDLSRIDRVQHNSNCSIVSIVRAADHAAAVGAQLMLEFFASADSIRFVEWAKRAHRSGQKPNLLTIEAAQLQKTMDNTVNNISKNFANKQHMQQADDMKVLSRNEATRNGAGRPASRHSAHPALVAPSEIKTRPTLRSQMRADADNDDAILKLSPPPERPTRSTGRVLRPSPPMQKPPSPELDSWTEQNPDWAANWRVALSFERNTIDKGDISRLDEGQFLNDSIINFYLKYLHKQLEEKNAQQAKKIYIFNSFFHEKLMANKKKGFINYEGVKSWTAKIDLLSYDYIIVPVNESTHWWVAIICNAKVLVDPQMVESDTDEAPVTDVEERKGVIEDKKAATTESSPLDSITTDVSQLSFCDPDENGEPRGEEAVTIPESPVKGNVVDMSKTVRDGSTASAKEKLKSSKKRPAPVRKYDPKEPRIITLDSLGAPHSPAVRALKLYLKSEVKDKKGLDIDPPFTFGMTAINIPLQSNFTDCGVYLLGYIEEFMKDPDRFTRNILQKVENKWELDAPALRVNIRTLIFDLQKQYQEEQMELRKARARAKKQALDRSSAAPSSPSRAGTEEHSRRSSVSASTSASRRATPVESSPVRNIQRNEGLFQRKFRSSPPAQRTYKQHATVTQSCSGIPKHTGNNTSMVVNVDDDSFEVKETPHKRGASPVPKKLIQQVIASIEDDFEEKPSKLSISRISPSTNCLAQDFTGLTSEPKLMPLLSSSSPPAKTSERRKQSRLSSVGPGEKGSSKDKTGSFSVGLKHNHRDSAARSGDARTPARMSTERSPYFAQPQASSVRKPVNGTISKVKAISSDSEQDWMSPTTRVTVNPKTGHEDTIDLTR